MQAEIDRDNPLGRRVHLLGVNQPGSVSGIATIVAGRRIPWLQDTLEADVASLIGADHFDLVILGPDRQIVEIQNLYATDLTDPAHYEELKARLEALARN